MSCGPRIRRLALLLALLPEILMLGLGQGFVLCIAPGGHVQLEIEASTCCAETGSSAAMHGPTSASSDHEHNCGPCSDVGTTLDPRAAQAPEDSGDELPAVSAALPEVALALRGAMAWTMPRVRNDADGGQESPHLVRLRSVMLLC